MKKIIFTIAMLSTVAVNVALAQTRRISGTVKDDQGPLPGASITVKGTNIGTSADDDGNFTLEVPEDKNIIVISSFGTETREIRIGNKTAYDVTLAQEAGESLKDVTVYGQKIDRRSYTGSVNTVSSKEIANRPVTSVGAALDGAAPGLLVTSGGGQPGSNPDIMMRGQGSLSASSSPLIVLDGAPYSGSLNSINPLDIKEIVVLKDATAKAAYGARASNGVILITTKRGERSDRPYINVDASVGFLSRFIPEYERLGTRDYYEMAWKAYVKGDATIQHSSNDFIYSFLGNYNAYKVGNDKVIDDNRSSATYGKVIPGDDQLRWTDDWQKELQRIGVRQNYQVSVANATETSDYYLSVGYTRDQGIVKNSDYHRITGLINVNSKVTDWLRTGFKVQASYDDQLFHLGSGTAYSNPFFAAREMGSIYPVYRYDLNGTRMTETDGTPVYDFGNNNDANTYNLPQQRPFGAFTNSIAALSYNKPYTIGVNGNIVGFVEADIYRDLLATTMISINYHDNNQLNHYNSMFGDASNVLGRSSRGRSTNINYNFQQRLTWTPRANNLNTDSADHRLSISATHENVNYKIENMSATRIGFPLPGYYELSLAAAGEGATSQVDRLRYESYIFQAAYDFKKKYYVSGVFSRNGSSRFSPQARWGNFGSAGVGWIISEEGFMKDWAKQHFDMIKLRFSWGISGNDNINNYYAWMNRFAAYHNANNPGLVFNQYGNADLKWEGSVDMNAGIDLVTKQSRLNVALDFYNRGSNNLLYVQPFAPSVGTGGYNANVGAMRNRGIEVAINYDILRPKTASGVHWNTRLNLAFNRNAVTKMQGDDTIRGGGTIMTKGLAVGTFYLPEYAGVDGLGRSTWYSGDSVTADYSALDPNNDYKVFGSSFRDAEGSWSNTIRYKQFDVNFTFTFGLGGKYYDQTYAGLVGGGDSRIGQAMHVDLLNSWYNPGDENNADVLPMFTYSNASRWNGSLSDRFLISNSFLRMRNFNVGYTFNQKRLTRANIRSLRVYASLDNVFNVSARQGVDLTSSFFGVSNFTYFPYRTVVFGFNLGL